MQPWLACPHMLSPELMSGVYKRECWPSSKESSQPPFSTPQGRATRPRPFGCRPTVGLAPGCSLISCVLSALTRETSTQMTGCKAASRYPRTAQTEQGERLAPQPENHPSHPRLPPSPRFLPRGPNPQPVSPQMTGPDSLVSSMDTSFLPQAQGYLLGLPLLPVPPSPSHALSLFCPQLPGHHRAGHLRG